VTPPARQTLVLLALACALLAASPDRARAQAPAPAAPAAELDTSQLGDAANAALDLFRGAAALGSVASCRTGAYGDDNPPLAGFKIVGELRESEDTLRALLDGAVPWTKKGRPYSEEACRAVRDLLGPSGDLNGQNGLGYHAEIAEAQAEGGVTLTLKLAPLTQVRRISVEGNLSVLGILGFDFRPIFATDIERRLRLQPGAPIDDDPELRRLALAADEQRIVEYLARRGYFDAEVGITTKDDGPHAVALTVHVERGPIYTVGQVSVAWRSGDARLTPDAAAQATGVSDDTVIDAVAQGLWIFGRGRFSYDQLQEDRDHLRELFQKKGYPAARVRIPYDPRSVVDRASKTVTLAIDINLGRKLTIEFDGVEHKSEESLRDALTFNAANAVDDFEAEASAEAIRVAYQGDGRFQTVVEFARTRLEPSESCPTCLPHDKVVFHVDEGPEQPVRSIGFQGNHAIDSAKLKSEVVKTEIFGLLGQGGYLTSVQLEQDEARIADAYHALGFAHVRVSAVLANSERAVGDLGALAAQVAAGDTGDGLAVRFDVDEGVQDTLESIGFAGNHAFTAAELQDASGLAPGRPVTTALLDKAAARVQERYLNTGYRTLDLRREVTGAGPHTRVTFTVIEGEKARAGKVVVRGNFATARWVILDTFDMREGQPFSADTLERGRAGLRATGLFTTIRTGAAIGHDPAHTIVDVGERYDRLAEIDLAGGLSTDNSVFASLTLGLRNLFGIGASLTGTGEIGLLRRAVQSNLFVPEWVMNRAVHLPVRAELAARYRQDQTPRFGALETLGFTVTFSRTIAKGVLLSLRFDWNQFNRSTELLRAPGADQETASTPIQTRTALVGPTLLVDQRDNPLAPSRGWFLSAQLGLASRYLLGTDDFAKISLAGQIFFPLGSRIVVTNSMRWDQGFPLGGAVLLPEIERFSAGGDTTVRGYEADRLATQIIRNPLAQAADATAYRVVPIGGNIRLVHRFDFQLRLVDFQSVSLASALFLDSGSVLNSFDGFVLARIRQGIGMGVRLITAAGAISFEYAFPLQPQLGDDPAGRLHIVFGISI
jgi:outer membrane protein insertion porin family